MIRTSGFQLIKSLIFTDVLHLVKYWEFFVCENGATIAFWNSWNSCVIVLCITKLLSEQLCIANVSILKTAKIVENDPFSGRVFCVSNFTKNKILYIHFLMLLPDFYKHVFPNKQMTRNDCLQREVITIFFEIVGLITDHSQYCLGILNEW